MQADMMLQQGQAGKAIITLSVPMAKAGIVAETIKDMLSLAGHKVRHVNADGEELVNAAEVFPDASPAMALRGLRGKEGITQEELAQKLGIRQNMVSDMESGKRSISVKMAKRIAETFSVPYKLFV